MRIPFLRNTKYVCWSVSVFALLLSGCISIYSPHSGIVVEKESGLPIENAILVRSWDRVTVSFEGGSHSWLGTAETVTDKNGKFTFWPRIFFSGIPLIMGTEENSYLVYRPGYGFEEIKELKKVIELPKIPLNRNTRKVQADKAQSSYSTDYYKTELLKEAVQQEEQFLKELSEPAQGVPSTTPALKEGIDRQVNFNRANDKDIVKLPSDCRQSAANSSEISSLIQRFNTLEHDAAIIKVACYGDDATPVLVEAISSSAASKYYIVQALSLIGTPRAIEALSDLILKCDDNNYDLGVRLAIESLEHLGLRGEKALIRSLANKNSTIQSLVSDALVRIGNPDAISGLITDLPSMYAAKALGKIKDHRAVGPLVKTLPLHYSIIALGEIKDQRAAVPLMREIHKTIKESNVEYLLDGNVPSNLTMKEKNDLRYNIPLLTELKKQRNILIEEALSEIGMPSMPKLYEIAAKVPDNIELDEQEAIFADHVVQLLVSEKTSERFLAEIAIAKIGKLIVPALMKALNTSDDVQLRKASAEQLGKMKWEPNVENVLVNALQDRNPLVVAYAACALGELKAKSALKPLVVVAKKESIFERRGAIWAIARIGSDEGKTVLKEFINDKDVYVRTIAKRALESSGT